jgi:hypothetical protein
MSSHRWQAGNPGRKRCECSKELGGVLGGKEDHMKRTVATLASIALALTIAVPRVRGAAKFTEWTEPTNLGCAINSTAAEQGPAISKDGLSLYFGSMRSDGFGGSDIWVSQRTGVDEPWGPPMNLGAIVNTPGADNIPALSRDGHLLFFNSDRPGTSGLSDIWVSYRENVHDDFGWETPMNAGPGVNSSAAEVGASYVENEEGGTPLLFFGRGVTLADPDIYVSRWQSDGSFAEAVLVRELSSPQSDQRPSVRFDGLEMFLFSNRPGSLGGNDLFVSTRATASEAWEAPTNLGPTINTPFGEMQPYIAADRMTLFFASNRPGGCGAFDLYMTTRSKLRGADTRHTPPALAGVLGSTPPSARKAFQLPSGSFFNTPSTVPRICFTSPPGDSVYEAVNVRHSTAQPPSRNVKSLTSGT